MRRGGEILNWVWLILALVVVGVLQVAGSVNHPAQRPLDPGSAQPNGALALNLWLHEVGYHVHAEVSPSITAASWRSRDTLMLLAPEADPAPKVQRSLAGWVRNGGHLVIIANGSATPSLFSTFGVSLVAVPPAPVHLVQPLLTAPAVGRLVGRTRNVVASGSGGIEVAGTSRGTAVLLERLGRGIIWIVSSPDLLANSGIARAGNRALALNLAGPSGSRVGLAKVTPPLPAPPGATDWLTGTTWGVVVLFGTLVALLYRGLANRRLGAPIEPPSTSFRPAVEYALSMAGLLRRGQKRSRALLPYQRSLQRLLQVRGIDVVPPELEAILRTDENLTERELISRAAAIVEYEAELARQRG